jgi:hypothetical protein
MRKLDRIELARVEYIPKDLEPSILYVAEEFGAAVHLCACGCGEKVSTPLRPTEWTLTESGGAPTLTPSVGNWQLPCRSHYWIRGGRVIWSGEWTPAQVVAGRRAEEERRRAYYAARAPQRAGLLQRLWRWIMSWFEG